MLGTPAAEMGVSQFLPRAVRGPGKTEVQGTASGVVVEPASCVGQGPKGFIPRWVGKGQGSPFYTQKRGESSSVMVKSKDRPAWF